MKMIPVVFMYSTMCIVEPCWASDELFDPSGPPIDVSAFVMGEIAKALRSGDANLNNSHVNFAGGDGCAAGSVVVEQPLPPGTTIANINLGSSICVQR